MRKLFSLLLVFCLLLPLCFAVSAEGLPIREIEAPQNMTFMLSYPNEGNECIEAVYSVPDDLCAAASVSADVQDKCYGTAFIACVQFDWSIDDAKSFHYNKSWDSTESDSPIHPISGSFVEKSEIFWFAYDTDIARCDGALRTQTVDAAFDESDPDAPEEIAIRSFDFDAHSLYVRARFFVFEDKTGATHFSDWSKPLNVKENLGADRKLSAKSTDAPLLTNASTDGDGTFTFDIGFTDAFKKTARELKSTAGTELNLDAQIRVDGGEWRYWIIPDALYPYHVGQRQFTVSAEDADKKIEFRCRESGGNPDFGTDVTTAWSSILTAENGSIQIVPNDDPFDEKVKAAEQAAAEREANKCKLCGICPHPLGVCLFLWLGLLVVIALIVWIVLARKKKEKARNAEIEARRAASAASDSDKTKSFVQTDRISLKKADKDEDKPQEDNAAANEEKPQSDNAAADEDKPKDEEEKQDEN